MNKSDLEKLSKSELIEFILNQYKKPVPAPRTKRPVPGPRKNVKQMVQNYEEKRIPPPAHRLPPPPSE